MGYIEEFRDDYHHFEFLFKDIRTTDALQHENNEIIDKHIFGGMNEKKNSLPCFSRKKVLVVKFHLF